MPLGGRPRRALPRAPTASAGSAAPPGAVFPTGRACSRGLVPCRIYTLVHWVCLVFVSVLGTQKTRFVTIYESTSVCRKGCQGGDTHPWHTTTHDDALPR